MNEAASASRSRGARIAPGLAALLAYRLADLPHDLAAGLSVAAVALPVGVAYAGLAGFEPAYGLYASILPLVAYAVFGTSRQLILGPDAATCALIAAAVGQLAGGDPSQRLPVAIAMTGLAGLFCIGASFLRLGALADFLSKPILVGFLNGIALSIMLGQVGRLLGIPTTATGLIPTLAEAVDRAGETHWPTLAVGLGAFVLLLASSRLVPKVPSAPVALVVAGGLSAALGLDARGVAVIGAVPAGLPALTLPVVPLDRLGELTGAAAGLALISFTSMMLTARSFAAKNRYDVDVDRELAALGLANLAAALSQTFAVSGADSRTATSEAAGGRTQLAGLVAAAAVAGVLMFLTGPLRFVPIAVLAAVLVRASLSLLDLATPRARLRLSAFDAALSVFSTVGVIWVGAINAVLIAVALALLEFVRAAARPRVEILGEVSELPGLHAVGRHPTAHTEPGLILFRFNASLVFLNASYFKQRAAAAIAEAGPGLRWFVLDALPLTQFDSTGLDALADIAAALREKGAVLVLAGRKAETELWALPRGIEPGTVVAAHFPTLCAAVRAWRAMRREEEARQGVPGTAAP